MGKKKKSYFFDVPFPVKGLDESRAFDQQEANTTPSAQNVRGYDPRSGRLRGASRAGLSKFPNSVHTTDCRIQDINHIPQTSFDYTAISADTLSVQTIVGVAVACGTVKKFTSSGFTAVTGGSGALSSSAPVIFSTEHFGKLYYCDGATYKVYDPTTNTVSDWTADDGDLPADSGYKGRLIETWRARVVISGIASDPRNWFMSRVNDAHDWNYGPATTCETDPVAGNNSPAGKLGDIIQTMIPYNDDLLIFGGDHTIWQMTGDPQAGGRIDLVSDTIGMAFGRPWCRDPSGIIYFFGSRGGVYRMAPGTLPERLTRDRIEERLANVNLATSLVRMVWNDREQGCHLFITPLAGGSTTHYFYDVRQDAWWPDVFANDDHNPLAVHVFDGSDPNDRALLLGGQDGFIRKWDLAAKGDDGTAIESSVYVGPLMLKDGSRMVMTELQGTLDADSDDVTYGVYGGNAAQEAFDSANAIVSGTWSASRNLSQRQRAQGHALFIKLSASTLDEAWALEWIKTHLYSTSRQRQRWF